ncbi:hypothetical protein D3C72_1846110 [compost metagenome]
MCSLGLKLACPDTCAEMAGSGDRYAVSRGLEVSNCMFPGLLLQRLWCYSKLLLDLRVGTAVGAWTPLHTKIVCNF